MATPLGQHICTQPLYFNNRQLRPAHSRADLLPLGSAKVQHGMEVQTPDSVLSRWPVLPTPLQSAPEPRSSLNSVLLLSCLFPGSSVPYPYEQDFPTTTSASPSFSQLLLWPCSTVLSHMVSGSGQSMTPMAGVQQSGPGGSVQLTDSSQLCSFVYN